MSDSDHKFYKCKYSCVGCRYCDGGLKFCERCGGAESSLPSFCPGHPMSHSQEELVSMGLIDFNGVAWDLKTPKVSVDFVNADLTKISLSPGDVLAIKVTSDEIRPDHLDTFKDYFKRMLPNNKIILSLLPNNSNMEFTAIKAETGCGPKACNDCSCGKKERLNQGEKNGS